MLFKKLLFPRKDCRTLVNVTYNGSYPKSGLIFYLFFEVSSQIDGPNERVRVLWSISSEVIKYEKVTKWLK